jgi:transposase, IS6 family
VQQLPFCQRRLQHGAGGSRSWSTCHAKAARRLLAKALRSRQNWPPHVINTDKNPAYGEAMRQLKRDPDAEIIEHRQVKYLNNRIEADHGPIKQLCRATLGFKSMKTAYATIKGFEVMRMIRKRQCILLEPGVTGEVRFVNKLFGLAA